MINNVAFTGAASKAGEMANKGIEIVGKYTSPYAPYTPALNKTNEEILKLAEGSPFKKIADKVEKVIKEVPEHIDYFA